MRRGDARQLAGVLLRGLPRTQIAAGTAVAFVLVWLLPGDRGGAAGVDGMQAAALALSLAVGAILEEPAAETVAAAPPTLLVRRAMTIALVAPVIAVAWIALAWISDVPAAWSAALTLQLAVLLLATLALAATLPYGAQVAGVAVVAGGALAAGAPVKTAAVLGPYTAVHAGVIVDAGVTGKARIKTRGDGSVVRLKATGLAADAAYGVHLHGGRCSDFGPHFRFDPAGPGTRDNEVWPDLRSNPAGVARDGVSVRSLPIGQPYSIVIHALSNPDQAPAGELGHPGARIACGDLEAR